MYTQTESEVVTRAEVEKGLADLLQAMQSKMETRLAILEEKLTKTQAENEDLKRALLKKDAIQAAAVDEAVAKARMLPVSEEYGTRAEAKRVEGNEAFQASDFLQAAVFYTEAIRLKPDLHLAWANRAQCFLNQGNPEMALPDAINCTVLAPD